MKCLSCDVILSPRESTRKFVGSKTYVDLCDSCFDSIADEVEVSENTFLSDSLDEEDNGT